MITSSWRRLGSRVFSGRAYLSASGNTTDHVAGRAWKHSAQDLHHEFQKFSHRPLLPSHHTPEEAAAVLAHFFGLHGVAPGDVLDLDADAIHELLRATSMADGSADLDDALYAHAESVTRRFFQDRVYLRGIIEFSNVCNNDCSYCGIRKHQHGVRRYTMPVDEVVHWAVWALRNGMGTLMLQSGELVTAQRLDYIEDMVRKVREATCAADQELGDGSVLRDTMGTGADEATGLRGKGLAVALSVGELSAEQYERLRDAGARRYLLRIESSNPSLYGLLHPAKQTWDQRYQALLNIKAAGLQLGTGVMVGLPGQTLRDLAHDIVFFRDIGADMIGMGPYIREPDTPAAAMWAALHPGEEWDLHGAHMKAMFELTTRMNALARVVCGNVNIAATTALQAVNPVGREVALGRGANVLMPIVTPPQYRSHYQLYEGKPCITDTADECKNCLNVRVRSIGKRLHKGVWGDPPHFHDPDPHRRASAADGRRACSSFSSSSSSSSYAAQLPRTGRLPLPSSAPSHLLDSGSSARFMSNKAGAGSGVGGALPGGVPRVNIGIFGAMNAGKSTLANALTGSPISIVDSTPGTTADTKVSLMELHDIGPCKIFDTAGVDEPGALGDKKRHKALAALKESDVAIIVVDPTRFAAEVSSSAGSDDSPAAEHALQWELMLLENASKYGALPLLLFNTRGSDSLVKHAVSQMLSVLTRERTLSHTLLDLSGAAAHRALTECVHGAVAASIRAHHVPVLPDRYLARGALVFLNIPMDAETPGGRLLRPQARLQEEVIRNWGVTIAYRMDLGAARGEAGHDAQQAERERFLQALQPLVTHTQGPVLLVTDSQAVDVVHPWTMNHHTGEPLVPFTTFSIALVHQQSGGRLPLFVEGLAAARRLRVGDRVLIAEACNHNRITVNCNDIGLVQIPAALQRVVPQVAAASGCGSGGCGGGLEVEHAFGREMSELAASSSSSSSQGDAYPTASSSTATTGNRRGLRGYSLAVHCGGCMVDQQQMRARITDLQEAGVPVTNYGLLLAAAHSPGAIARALEPWGLKEDGGTRGAAAGQGQQQQEHRR